MSIFFIKGAPWFWIYLVFNQFTRWTDVKKGVKDAWLQTCWYAGHQYAKIWGDGKLVIGAVGACLCIQSLLTTDYTTHTPLQRAQTLPVFTGATGGPPPQTHTPPLALPLALLSLVMHWILSLTVNFALNWMTVIVLVKLTFFLLVSSGIRISGR